MSKPCRFFQKNGRCRYGFRCKFSHVSPSESSEWKILDTSTSTKVNLKCTTEGCGRFTEEIYRFCSVCLACRNVIPREKPKSPLYYPPSSPPQYCPTSPSYDPAEPELGFSQYDPAEPQLGISHYDPVEPQLGISQNIKPPRSPGVLQNPPFLPANQWYP